MRAIDSFLSALMLLTAACGGSDEASSNGSAGGNLTGSFNGASFSVVGAMARTSALPSLTASLANKEVDCQGGVHPVNGTMVVDVGIPPSDQKSGMCALGISGDTACVVSVTTFDENADGMPHQTSKTLLDGTLQVVSITETALEAKLDFDADGVVLKGKFVAPRCPE